MPEPVLSTTRFFPFTSFRAPAHTLRMAEGKGTRNDNPYCSGGVHPNTVRQWANKEFSHTYRLGPRHDRRFKHEEVENFLRQDNLQVQSAL